jgi:exosortase
VNNPRTVFDRCSWVVPLIVCLAGCFILFGVLPYAFGYGLVQVSLFQHAIGGMFVFPVVAFLVYWRRKDLAKIPIQGSWLGLPVLLLAVFLYWIGYLSDLQQIGFLSVMVFLAGFVIWFLGLRFFGAVFFIWAFLIFVWPFPFLEEYVAFPLRMLMSELSGRFLNVIGVPTIREGTAIFSSPDLIAGIVKGARFSVDVADPCSGIRSLFALTMISALYGILSFRKWWQILIVFLVVFPFAVFGNFCRIVMLTFGAMWLGADFAIGTPEQPTWYHMGAGFIVYIASLLGVLGVGWLVGRNWKRRGPAPESVS